jgi:hypothetical protein
VDNITNAVVVVAMIEESSEDRAVSIIKPTGTVLFLGTCDWMEKRGPRPWSFLVSPRGGRLSCLG